MAENSSLKHKKVGSNRISFSLFIYTILNFDQGWQLLLLNFEILFRYRKIASSNTSRLEAHVGFFRLLMKGIFGPNVL